jgi:hypothetical protein
MWAASNAAIRDGTLFSPNISFNSVSISSTVGLLEIASSSKRSFVRTSARSAFHDALLQNQQ